MTRTTHAHGRTRTRSKSRRPGITLLEVLISMFVALVGLSGLAALFWLGGIEMSEGAKSDRTLTVARAAQRSFKILGMHRPIQTFSTISGLVTTNTQVQMWLTPAGATIDGSGTPAMGAAIAPVMPFSTTSFGTTANITTTPNVAYGYYGQGFAIDPIGVLANSGNSFTTAAGFPALDLSGNTITYPAQTSTTPCIPTTPNPTPIPCLSRITFQAYPQNSTAATYPQSSSTPLYSYSAGQADLVFRSQDDLLLNAANGDYPPTQLFSPAGRRQSQGDYSWLATVVPTVSAYQSDTTNSPTVFTPVGDPNLVRVSTVVFYKRVPLVSHDPSGTTPPSERMVQVNMTPYLPGGTVSAVGPTGVAGGDVQLISTSQSYLNLKAGQWIMLSQAPQSSAFNAAAANPPPNVKLNTTYWYRWYKVVATSPTQPDPTGTAGYYRNVTLSGPDWNPGTAAAPIATYASIFDGVVAVFEKEIELEASGSPWSPN